MRTSALYGTEIAFRLGPGHDDEARGAADRLAAAAHGALRCVLFLSESGEYGCLAEWADAEDARSYAALPEVRAVLEDLAARLGKTPGVRLYAMEEQRPGGAG